VVAKPAGANGQAEPGFSICVVNRVDKRVRREYVLASGRVRLVSESDCPAMPPVYTPPTASGVAAAASAAPATPSAPRGFFQRLKERWKALTK